MAKLLKALLKKSGEALLLLALFFATVPAAAQASLSAEPEDRASVAMAIASALPPATLASAVETFAAALPDEDGGSDTPALPAFHALPEPLVSPRAHERPFSHAPPAFAASAHYRSRAPPRR